MSLWKHFKKTKAVFSQTCPFHNPNKNRMVCSRLKCIVSKFWQCYIPHLLACSLCCRYRDNEHTTLYGITSLSTIETMLHTHIFLVFYEIYSTLKKIKIKIMDFKTFIIYRPSASFRQYTYWQTCQQQKSHMYHCIIYFNPDF
jgi:hypothetical protein